MTWDSGRERLERDRLLARLLDLGIDAPVVHYPAHTSIEEGKRLRGNLPGAFTKNLLLKDKKARLFFVTAFEDTDVDLKTLHTRIVLPAARLSVFLETAEKAVMAKLGAHVACDPLSIHQGQTSGYIKLHSWITAIGQ